MTTSSTVHPAATHDDGDVRIDIEALEAELLCEVERINRERLAA